MSAVRICVIFVFLFAIERGSCRPQDVSSLVVSSTEPPQSPKEQREQTPKEATIPEIYKMLVRADVRNRYLNATVTSKVRNVGSKAQEATFSVILPEDAFISGFVMEVDGKNYTAYVKEKEEAKKTYEQAVASGLGAAHVAVSARDSNRFTVSVNVEPNKKAAFYLTYEELLKRRDSRYEIVINLHPGQPIKDLGVEVEISESRKVLDVKAPPLRSGNEISADKVELDPRAQITRLNDSAVVVKFSPNEEMQKQFAKAFGTKEDEGLQGQFVVQYEVERDPSGGEVLLNDGYFVHFFAPSDLPPLPKQIVIVLDTSGSMWGTKLVQVKQAITSILDDLQGQDYFNLVEFNSNVKTWNLDNENASALYPTTDDYWNTQQQRLELAQVEFPSVYAANKNNIELAKKTVNKFTPDGGTNILDALKVALHLVELAGKGFKETRPQPLVVFLTDGEPTVGTSSVDKIIKEVTEFNSGPRKTPIYALSFGDGADRNFLEKLSSHNQGFSKHIYEAADASLQLQDFYKQISSPLLTNVTFKYTPSEKHVTTSVFPILFGGSEIVVCGQYTGDGNSFLKEPEVRAWGIRGPIILKPKVEKPWTGLERMWAYLTVQQLLERMKTADDKKEEIKKQALDLALKYSFVTKVSSLVVVKPNDTKSIDTEDAAKKPPHPYGLGYGGTAAVHASAPISGFSGTHFSVPAQSAGIPGPPASPAYYMPNTVNRHPMPYYPTTTRPHQTSLDYASGHKVQSEPIAETDPIPDSLPWLKAVVSGSNQIQINSTTYPLGLNTTLPAGPECLKTPTNSTGHCMLLQQCSHVHNLLVSFDVYINYFCEIQGFAGVCCPDVKQSVTPIP